MRWPPRLPAASTAPPRSGPSDPSAWAVGRASGAVRCGAEGCLHGACVRALGVAAWRPRSPKDGAKSANKSKHVLARPDKLQHWLIFVALIQHSIAMLTAHAC